MGNRVFLTLISVMLSISLNAVEKQTVKEADYITVNTAYDNVLEFINARTTTGHKAMRKAPLSQSDLTLCAERPSMYIFNVGKSEGFVVASASSLTRPILCYSTDGQWDDKSVNESLGWLFEQYDAEIAAARHSKAKAPSVLTSISKSPIEPLIKTEWYQGEPYNNKLTAFTWGGKTYRVPTGCVATAMGQIMNYHQWPKTIRQEIPGYNHGQVIGDDAVEVNVSGVAAGTVIDWDKLNVPYVTSSDDPEVVDAVSNLMRYCGAAVRMYYSETVSSSHNISAMYALKHYFDYDPTIYIADRSNYSYYDWCNLLYEELRAGRPILYNGQGSGGGHSFIIDGYDGNEMFHFNLGWAQKSSIYAILSSVGHDTAVNNLDAYDSPDGYVYHQTAVMNVQKPELSDGIYHVSLTCDIGFWGETIDFCFYNNEDEPYTLDLGIGYRDADGNIQVVQATEGVEMGAASAKSQQYEASSLTLPSGTYHLLPIARLSGGKSDWQFVTNELNYQIATASGDGVVTLTEHKRLADLATESITFSGFPYAGEELYVFCNIKNRGEEDYFDKLYFFWNDNPANKGIDAGHYILWSHATVNAGGSAPVEFYFTPTKAGDYTVWITTDYEGENVVGQATISVEEVMPFNVGYDTPLTISNVKVANLKDGTIIGNDVAVEFDATNTSASDYFQSFVVFGINLYDRDGVFKGERNVEEIVRPSYVLAPGQTRHFQFSIQNVQPDYEVEGKAYLGSWKPVYITDKYRMQSAALAYTPSGVKTPVARTETTVTVPMSAAAVDLTMVANKVKKVVPNSNPNTIYYLNVGDAVPGGLEGHNIVFGDHAEKIVLDGDFGVAVPKQFVAKAVEFTKKLNKDKWSTLCVPFSFILNNANVEIAAITDEDVNHIQANPTKRVVAYQTYFTRSKTDGAQTITDTNVQFPKQDNAISVVNNYKAQGVMGQTIVMNAYVLNDEGTALSFKTSAQMKPFTSFFMVTKRGYAPSSAVTFDVDETQALPDGIMNVSSEKSSQRGSRYNLAGQRVDQGYRGIVVENGRKILVK